MPFGVQTEASEAAPLVVHGFHSGGVGANVVLVTVPLRGQSSKSSAGLGDTLSSVALSFKDIQVGYDCKKSLVLNFKLLLDDFTISSELFLELCPEDSGLDAITLGVAINEFVEV